MTAAAPVFQPQPLPPFIHYTTTTAIVVWIVVTVVLISLFLLWKWLMRPETPRNRLGVQEFPTVVGEVESWNAEVGWGVLRTPDGLSVFCHFSRLDGPGFRMLSPGQRVRFDYRTPGQDGWDASVMTRATPVE